MRGKIADFLHKLQRAGVRLPAAAASLLLLSQEGQPENVAQSLAALHAEPALHGFLGWLPWICDELIEPEPDAKGRVFCAEMPQGTSLEDRETVVRALGYSSFGPDHPVSLASSHAREGATEDKAPVDEQIAADAEPDEAASDAAAGLAREEAQSNGREANKAQTSPDGPMPPNWLWWKGQKLRIGTPKSKLSWLLLSYFWNRDSATFQELEGPGKPWPDPVSESAKMSAVTRFNNDLPAGFPWRLRTANFCVEKVLRENPPK
jgi:hypothetical protein